MCKAFLYRLYPHKEQSTKLDNFLDVTRELYNAALAERRYAWRMQRKSVSYYDQSKEFTELRKENPELAMFNYTATREVLVRLDKTFASFFRRIKNGEKAGYPRFKGKNRFNSITFPTYGDGIKLRDGRLYIQNIGLVKIKMHRELEGEVNTVAIKRVCGKWYVVFSNSVDIEPLPYSDRKVGIDVGLESFAVTSDKEFIENPRWLLNSQRKLRIAQRSVARKKFGGSNRRKAVDKLAKLHQKIQNQRKDFTHKLSRDIVNRYGFIAVEDLRIRNMVKNRHLAQGISDAAWGQFIGILSYKAEWAGREFAKVNPKGTSQICAFCGEEALKTLATRIHHCPHCGIHVHRDFNSSLNILRLGLSLWDLTWEITPSVSQEAVCAS